MKWFKRITLALLILIVPVLIFIIYVVSQSSFLLSNPFEPPEMAAANGFEALADLDSNHYLFAIANSANDASIKLRA